MEAREVVGKYRIARKLGQGGMGSVFEAVDEKIKSHVALKILNLQCSQNIQVVMRFLNEAQIANSIRHPGIVKVYDHGFLPSGEAYLAMELLQGVSLRERMRQGCSEADVIRWARQTASALSAAHDLGVVHRDLKPDNLMLVSDPEVAGGERIKVLDFGIARITRPEHFGEPSGMTATGMLIGTPSYMAPEQCSSAKTTNDKADVYALGVILYEALGGELPFAPRQAKSEQDTSGGGGELIEILFHHLHSPPPSLASKRADLSPQLCELTHLMLAKSPAQRPSMRELLQRLDELSRGASDRLFGVKEARESGALTPAYEAAAPSAAVRASLWAQRGVLGWLVAGFLALGGAGLWTQRRAPPPESQRAAASLRVSPSPQVVEAAASLAPSSPSPPSGPVALVPPSVGASPGAAPKHAPDITDSPAHEAQSRPSAHGGRGKRVPAPRRGLAGATRSTLSPNQISERLEQARAALSQGQADETLRLTRELEEAGGRLSATQMQEAQSLRGRAACIVGDAQEASRAHAALVSGFHRGLIESFCAKHQVRCAESRRGALCTTLRQEAAPAAPALPTTLRDPFPGAGRGRP